PGRGITEREIHLGNGSKLFRQTEPPHNPYIRGPQQSVSDATEHLASHPSRTQSSPQLATPLLDPSSPSPEIFFDPMSTSDFELDALRRVSAQTNFATNIGQQRGDIGQQVARQIAENAPRNFGTPVQINLSPDELGHVRLSVTTMDGAVTVNILAERPDTLDLMRRHIDHLGQDFRALGYDEIAFSFARSEDSQTETSGENGRGDLRPDDEWRNDDVYEMPVSSKNRITKEAGLDIRL
ncbi:flagellar hook-length control protein FliK, partial [Sulfitobacter aestuarii]